MSLFDFDVFLSYSHEDQLLARAFCSWLRQAGLTVWHDEEQLVPGSRFRAGLQQGIRESRHMVAILTPSYCERPWTQRELDLFDLTADHSERRLVAVQIGALPAGPLDQVFLVHQRVLWSGEFLELDPEGLWKVYCGLTGTRPGSREQWESRGRSLASSMESSRSATSTDATKSPQSRELIQQVTWFTDSDFDLDPDLRAGISRCLDSPNDDWARLFKRLRDELAAHTIESERETLSTMWWARGYAESAATLALLSLPQPTSPYDVWAFLDLECHEIANWLLTRMIMQARQPSELWFSWAVSQRCWSTLPDAARLAPDSVLQKHFLTLARPAVKADVTFQEFEPTYDYGVMITPWNHFHLSWLAVRLGDLEAATAHALMLCSTTLAGDVRTGRFLNRLTTWELFSALRTRDTVGETMSRARTALGVLPSEAITPVRHRLNQMWEYVKSSDAG